MSWWFDLVFFFKQKTAYEMRISDWSSDVCSSDLIGAGADMFVACQRRIVVGEAAFRFPGAAFGLVLGTGRLARLVGSASACDWVGSGRWVEHSEALACGLITQAVDEAGTGALLEQFAKESGRLDRTTRRAVYRSEEPTSELQSLMRISYAVFCLKKKTNRKR